MDNDYHDEVLGECWKRDGFMQSAPEYWRMCSVLLQYVAKPAQLIHSPINLSAACAETHLSVFGALPGVAYVFFRTQVTQ
jgi:hypothetical protein